VPRPNDPQYQDKTKTMKKLKTTSQICFIHFQSVTTEVTDVTKMNKGKLSDKITAAKSLHNQLVMTISLE